MNDDLPSAEEVHRVQQVFLRNLAVERAGRVLCRRWWQADPARTAVRCEQDASHPPLLGVERVVPGSSIPKAILACEACGFWTEHLHHSVSTAYHARLDEVLSQAAATYGEDGLIIAGRRWRQAAWRDPDGALAVLLGQGDLRLLLGIEEGSEL